MTLGRDTTRAVLTAAAAGASVTDALSVGAAHARSEGRTRSAEAISRVIAELRTKVPPGELATEIEALGFDPPLAASLLIADQRAEATAIALEALRGETKPLLPPLWLFTTMASAVVLIGVVAVLRTFVAPVFQVPATPFDVAAWMGMGSLFVAVSVIAFRARDPLFGASAAAWIVPWLLPFVWKPLEAHARRRVLGHGSFLRLIAAGAAIRLPLSQTLERITPPRAGRRARLADLHALAAAGSWRAAIAAWAGPSGVARIANATFEGDSDARAMLRLARVAHLDRPRHDLDAIALLGAMVLVIGGWAVASITLMTQIAALGDLAL